MPIPLLPSYLGNTFINSRNIEGEIFVVHFVNHSFTTGTKLLWRSDVHSFELSLQELIVFTTKLNNLLMHRREDEVSHFLYSSINCIVRTLHADRSGESTFISCDFGIITCSNEDIWSERARFSLTEDCLRSFTNIRRCNLVDWFIKFLPRM